MSNFILKPCCYYYVQNYNIEYVFYDYIFSSPGLLGEYRDLKVREDIVEYLNKEYKSKRRCCIINVIKWIKRNSNRM